MRRFQNNNFIRYQPQPQFKNQFIQNSQYMPNSQFMPNSQYMQTSQFMPNSQFLQPNAPCPIDRGYNDDCISVHSQSTCPQSISQDNMATLKNELFDMFKELVETSQKNFTNLIESVKNTNEETSKILHDEVEEIGNTEIAIQENEPITEFDEIKNKVLMMREEHWNNSEEIKNELQKIIEAVNKLKNIKKNKKKYYNNKVSNPVTLKRPEPKSYDHPPCECFFNRERMMTRRQIMKGIANGKLVCICKNN